MKIPILTVALGLTGLLCSSIPAALASTATVTQGEYVKGTNAPAVYLVDRDSTGRLIRRPFLNPQIFSTWQPNFQNVVTVDSQTLSSLPLGFPVMPKTGVALVKSFSSSPVYAVSNNILRWITSEAVATRLYGTQWTSDVIQMPQSDLALAPQGDPITATTTSTSSESATTTTTTSDTSSTPTTTTTSTTTSTPTTSDPTPVATTPTTTTTPSTGSGSSDSGSSATAPTYDHVVILIDENTASGSVNASSAPYLSSLGTSGLNLTNMYAETHPSQPNYLHLFSGSNQGVTGDTGAPYHFTAANLASQLIAKGLTFGAYSEGLPSEGYTGGDTGGYAIRHAPWVNFTNVPAATSHPFTDFPTSDFSQLPTVSIVVPNLCDDMHDCSTTSGDNWVKSHLDAYVQWAKTHNSLLITTWDEDDSSSTSNHIATFVDGANVPVTTNATTLDHHAILGLVEDIYGLDRIAGSIGAPSILNMLKQTTATTTTPSSGSSTTTTVAATTTNPFVGASFYVDPNSSAAQQVNSWQTTRPTDASALKKISTQSTARWFGDWNTNIQSDVSGYVSTVTKTGAMPVLVAYNIPNRDCGGYSSGGAVSDDAYRAWIKSFASGIGTAHASVILEPDSTATSCENADRLSLLGDAVKTLKQNANTSVYIDAGHDNWIDATTMAGRLQAADVADADGFALNVSNFYTNTENTTYGTAVSQLIGGKHFIIDTSRNGNGWNGEWCNPSGRKIGQAPTTSTGNPLIDAFLWVKPPGESDGSCNGGPSAGSWWADYALGLVS